MRIFKDLVSVFMKSGEMDDPKQKKKKAFYSILGFISITCIMIPACFLVGVITNLITHSLMELVSTSTNNITITSEISELVDIMNRVVQGKGLLLILHLLNLFAVVFGIPVILNIFYYSKDIEYILPLPIKPWKIVSAKFTTAYFSESIIEFFVIISALVGYFMAVKAPIWTYFVGALGVVTLPIIPLLYPAIICMILMTFSKFLKSRDTLQKLGNLLTVGIMLGLLLCIGLLNGLDVDHFASQLAGENNRFVNVMNYIFPQAYYFEMAVGEYNVLAVAKYILVHVGYFAIFIVVAKLTYFRGLRGVQQTKEIEGRLDLNKLKKTLKPHLMKHTYFKKELKLIMRTPMFFLNCIIMNIIWPILFYALKLMQGDKHLFDKFILEYAMGNDYVTGGVLFAVAFVSVLLTSSNSIASSCITREGKQFSLMKIWPITYKEQLKIKARVSLFVSYGFMLLYIVFFSIYLDVDNKVSYLYLFISALAVHMSTYFGVYLDTVNSKLLWDDESNALRGNSNVFFNMAYSLIIIMTVIASCGLLYYAKILTYESMEILFVAILIILDVAIYRFALNRGSKNLNELNV